MEQKQSKKCECGYSECKCEVPCKTEDECLGRWQCCGCKPCTCEPGSKCCIEKTCCDKHDNSKGGCSTEHKHGHH